MRLRLSVAAAAGVAVLFATVALGATPTVAIFTIAGGDGQGFKGDGKQATSASLDGPSGLVAAPDGGIIVADTINQRVRRIDPSGRILTIAGNGRRGFGGDGGPPLAASFEDPTALALRSDGSLFIADTGDNRIRVLRPNATIVTAAGTADQGFSGDGGPATSAQLNAPTGLAINRAGDVFVADTGNNRVRVIHPNGVIETVAGTGDAGFAGDGGPARLAKLNTPAGLAIAGDGALLIADAGNGRIRRVAADGTISTVATGLNLPVDVAAVPSGGFFVAEQGRDRVLKVDANGAGAPLAGTGAPRYGGDGHAAAGAYLNSPQAVELLPSNYELVVADTDNNRIRYIGIPGQSSLLALAPTQAPLRAPLVKRPVTVHGHRRQILAVRDVPFPFESTKPATLVLRIRTKRGKAIATLRGHVAAGAGAVNLPPRLRSGKHRLKKDHYVVGVTATTGTATTTASFALIVK
jgi:sugar lactone lactonase YvrE